VLAFLIALWTLQVDKAAAAAPSTVAPESVGFSSERLKRLDEAMQRAVDEKQYAGVVTLLARHGKVIHFSALGQKDIASGAPLEKDTIFRINSMTKPLTAAAMMILYEEGRWTPQDPVFKFVPQFQNLKVFKGTDATGKLVLEDPAHPPTMRELMTHTAGFGYEFNVPDPPKPLYRDDQGHPLWSSGSLQAMVDRLAKAPLVYEPSTRWQYSISVDIQGYIIEKLSGMTLPDFMKKRLLAPLGMKDTDFYVPQEKRSRFVTAYERNAQGNLTPIEFKQYGLTYDREPDCPAGGAGMISTAVDYYRFAQMLANGGTLDGARILGPETVKLMMSSHIAPNLMPDFRGGGYVYIEPRPGLGFGFNGVVITDPGMADTPTGKGTYFWEGANGTWFWVDPANDIVFVGMVQRSGYGESWGMVPNLREISRATVYQALLRPDL